MSKHPFHSRREPERICKQHEEDLGKAFGWRVPASGSSTLAHKKGDAQSEELLIDGKATRKSSYKIDYGSLAKVLREAEAIGKVPVLAIKFLADKVKVVGEREWVLVPMSWFERQINGTTRQKIRRKIASKD